MRALNNNNNKTNKERYYVNLIYSKIGISPTIPLPDVDYE